MGLNHRKTSDSMERPRQEIASGMTVAGGTRRLDPAYPNR